MKIILLRCCFAWCAFWMAGAAEVASAASKKQEAKLDKLFEEAGALHKKGDLAGAEARMTEAINLAPGESPAYYNRALFRHQLGRQEMAKQDIDRYLRLQVQLQGSADDGYELRARIRLAQDDQKGALQDAHEALRLNKERHAARFIRASIEQARGRYREALEDYEQLSRVNDKDDRVLAGRAECELALGKFVPALTSFRTLSARHPEDGWVHYKIGQAAFALHQFEVAIAGFERAAELKVDRADTLRLIGYCHYGSGNNDAAIVALKEAIAINPKTTPYAYMVLHLAVRRAERSVSESPLKDAIGTWSSQWAQAVGRYLTGQIDDRKLVDQAKSTKNSSELNDQLCEAYFYIGSTRLLELDRVAAEVFFERVLGTRNETFVEYTLSRAELRRM